MKRFSDLVEEVRQNVREIMPWELRERLQHAPVPLLIDVREPYEFATMHMQDALNAPRGIIETAAEFGYEDTIPALAGARAQEIVVMCRSGNRSLLAAHTLQTLGFQNVVSLRTGLRGWSEFDQTLIDASGIQVSMEHAEDYFKISLRPEQKRRA